MALFALVISACTSQKDPAVTAKASSWGKTPGGESVDLYTLRNARGAEARIITYGGVVVSIKVPDRSGTMG